jgi:hypothetical protein
MAFEPTISAGEWPQTYALDRVATGTGSKLNNLVKYYMGFNSAFKGLNGVTDIYTEI